MTGTDSATPLLMPEDDLDLALEAIARVPILLVATDYDGTLSPIVDNPDDAQPIRESIIALRALAQLSGTHCAVISGRSLSDLAKLSALDGQVMLVGSHGSEFDQDFVRSLTQQQIALRQQVLDEMHRIAARDERFHIEPKPASIAFHYRNVDEPRATEAVEELLGNAAPGMTCRSSRARRCWNWPSYTRRRATASTPFGIGSVPLLLSISVTTSPTKMPLSGFMDLTWA